MPNSKPKVAQKSPYVKQENPGKRAWCSCGLSIKQPFCDGSHKNGDLSPLIVDVKESCELAWCGCKQTKTPPYCDGSHELLD